MKKLIIPFLLFSFNIICVWLIGWIFKLQNSVLGGVIYFFPSLISVFLLKYVFKAKGRDFLVINALLIGLFFVSMVLICLYLYCIEVYAASIIIAGMCILIFQILPLLIFEIIEMLLKNKKKI